jgi:hypothetical protein
MTGDTFRPRLGGEPLYSLAGLSVVQQAAPANNPMRLIHPGPFSNLVFVRAFGHDPFSEDYTLDHFRQPPVK